MESNLFFSCGFQANNDWNIVSNREEVTKEKMLEALEHLKYHVGSAGLEIIPEPNIGVSELSVKFDNEKYLLTAIEYSEEGDMLIRGPGSDTNELVDFLSEGELYPSSSVTNDFNLVKQVFIEFFITGSISDKLMKIVY